MYNYIQSIVVTVGSIIIIKKIFTWYQIHRKIKRKKNENNNRKLGLFQKFQGMRTPLDNKDKVCNLTGKEIHEKIKSKELSVVDVLEAFQANAIIKNNEFNFLADVIYEADVSALLNDFQDDSEINGFPLAVSDSLCIEKYDCTFGLLKETFKPSSRDCMIITVLKEAGAIPAIITNVSQGDLSVETSNPVFGKTLNSVNVKKTCGGSSGGLAVALATCSSIIGIGNDIHGNIRIPASFCGVFGLKTTSLRISSRHVKRAGFKQNIIKDSIGPMARNIDDLISLFKSMVSKRVFELDPLCCPIPFDETLISSRTPLRIGYYVGMGDGHLYPVPAVERAVLLAKKALERAGHTLVEYQLPDPERIVYEIYTKIIHADGGQSIIDMLKNERTDSSMETTRRILMVPKLIRRLLGFGVGLFCKRGGNWLSGMAGVSSTYEVWQLEELVQSYREQVLASWEKENLDGLICPVLPIVAPDVNRFNFLLKGNAYVIVYNVIDYVAGSVPVTRVNEEDIEKLRNSYSKKSRCCDKVAKSQTDSLGLPVGVQCVALPWREEMALRVMKNLKDNL